ncbi:MAG: O-antigen ligase family protein [Patiriisocius sp.]|uniref:O-antigen ligase family protein n=1 Tax=Patiriisocius sp. TaxID=2822396 RepID=UPI003EF6FB8A
MKNWLKKFQNYFKQQANKEFHFLLALVLVLITIPLPKYNLNSQAIIMLCIAWLLLNTFSEKLALLKKNIRYFFILVIPFLVYLAGMIYTDNPAKGIFELMKIAPFLLFPIIFSTIDYKFIDVEKILSYFPIGVFIASLLAIAKASFFYFSNLGDYFYYDQLALFLNKHTTYFSFFVVIGIFLLIKDMRKALILNIALIFFFILMLYFLSVRISIVAITVVFIFFILSTLGGMKKIITLLLIPLAIVFVINTPNFQKRFEPSNTEVTSMEDIDFRKLHWKSVIQSINKKPLFGRGTEGNRDDLYDIYRKEKLTAAYVENYNAHNQLLEIGLDFGILGIIIFLIYIALLIRISIINSQFFLLQIIIISLIYTLTESIFVRHSGIVLYTFLISFLLLEPSKHEG